MRATARKRVRIPGCLVRVCAGLTVLTAVLSQVSCDQVPPAGPYGVGIETGVRQMPAGDEIEYDLFVPERMEGLPGPPWPAVVLTRGFSRERSNMHEDALYLAQRGIAVLTPDLDGLLEGESAQLRNIANTADHVAWLARRSAAPDDPVAGLIDPDRIALAGFSSGGAVSFEAAIEAQSAGTPVAALLLLDATPWPRTIDRAAQLQPLTVASLRSEPARCNRGGRVLDLLAGLGFAVPDVRIVGAAHCDVENPTDAVCVLVCGGTGHEQREIYQRLTYLFLQDSLAVPSAEAEPDTYAAALERLAEQGAVIVQAANVDP